MIDEYKIQGPTQELAVKIQKPLISQLEKMADHKDLTVDEIVNTAVKRFITTHSDFLPHPESEI